MSSVDQERAHRGLTAAQGGEDPDDPLSVVTEWRSLGPMILLLAVAGTLLSLAAADNWTWAFVLGFVLVALWVGGLFVKRLPPWLSAARRQAVPSAQSSEGGGAS